MISPQQVLKRYFGYDAFREGQETLINDILLGKDVMGIMPTGAGKSICFQVPALIMDGITLVISPLISLMKDQVDALTVAGIPAAVINSTLSEDCIYDTLHAAANGAYKLIYVAPERLTAPSFLDFAKQVTIAMITIDEVHCISQWGQDFRPSYAMIPKFVSSLPYRPIVSAFTATATPKVREDVLVLLALHAPTVLVTGFNRKNLYFEVQKPRSKFKALLSFLVGRKEKSGIIYCSTRKKVEDVYVKLNENGYKAGRYHAGLTDTERHSVQEDFLYDRINIIVATNAFGMGIDKSNVSYVVHFNMPKDIESYYQEAGRAGRDGEKADCVLLFNRQDVQTNIWLIENGTDIEAQDFETARALRERKRKRLAEMTSYCETTECLRHYILRYFGEQPPTSCGNCSNCNGDFEMADITIDAQKILSCVGRMGQKYGIKLTIDVLNGKENEKVQSLGFNTLSTFGISTLTDKALRDIIYCLIMEKCLYQTPDEYPVLKFGENAAAVLHGARKVTMKLPKAEQLAAKEVQGASENATYAAPKPLNKGLFAALKAVRLQIANAQNVPAFVVFSDSTLTDMCIKQPQNDGAFLNVIGVGQVKLERYGKPFIDAIRQFVSSTAAKTADDAATATADAKTAGETATAEADAKTAWDTATAETDSKTAGEAATDAADAKTAEGTAMAEADAKTAKNTATAEADSKTAWDTVTEAADAKTAGETATAVTDAKTAWDTATAAADAKTAGEAATVAANAKTAGETATAAADAKTARYTATDAADAKTAGEAATAEADSKTAEDTAEVQAEIEIEKAYIPINMIADKINCINLQNGKKKLSGQRINDWLVSKQFLEVVVKDGRNYKVPTPLGTAFEIVNEERLIRGEKVLCNKYGKKIQEFISQNVEAIMHFEPPKRTKPAKICNSPPPPPDEEF